MKYASNMIASQQAEMVSAKKRTSHYMKAANSSTGNSHLRNESLITWRLPTLQQVILI